MRIRIKTDKTDFTLPVPLAMAGFAIRKMPERIFDEMRRKVAAPYDVLVCRENLLFLYEACRDELMECTGMEIIHVEGADGMYISVVL